MAKAKKDDAEVVETTDVVEDVKVVEVPVEPVDAGWPPPPPTV